MGLISVHKSIWFHTRLPVLFASAIAISACGGGGSGDVAPPTQSTVLNYVLSGARAPVTFLTVSGTATNGAVTASFTSPAAPAQELPYLTGTYDTSTLDYVLNSSPNPAIWVDTSGAGAPFGNLEITITQAFHWREGNEPSSGALKVTSRDATFVGTILLSVTASPAPGVNIGWDSDNNGTPDATQFYTWDQFDMLWDDNAQVLWHRIASFTYSMRNFIYNQAGMALEAFTEIEDNFSAIETNGAGVPLTDTCSPNPPDASWANSLSVTWQDNDTSGTISNEDSFTFALDNCWYDDPANNIDTVLNGTMNFLHYDRHVQACPEFVGFTSQETDAGGVIPGTVQNISGGICLFIPGI